MNYTLTLDHSKHITVVLCSCGWRDAAPTRSAAWRLGAIHQDQVHDDRERYLAAGLNSRRVTT